MTRREFPTRIKVAVIKRATVDNVIFCEKCGALAKRFQIDHIRPDAMLGEPVLENAMLICEPCYGVKNPQDTRQAAHAKRREAKHIGAARPKQKILSAGFVKKAKPEKLPMLPARNIYGDTP